MSKKKDKDETKTLAAVSKKKGPRTVGDDGKCSVCGRVIGVLEDVAICACGEFKR